MRILLVDDEQEFCTLYRAKKEVHLTPKEFMLLEYLLRNKGGVLPRSLILEHVGIWIPIRSRTPSSPTYEFTPQTRWQRTKTHRYCTGRGLQNRLKDGFETGSGGVVFFPTTISAANWLLDGRTLVSGRKSDSDFIFYLACACRPMSYPSGTRRFRPFRCF